MTIRLVRIQKSSLTISFFLFHFVHSYSELICPCLINTCFMTMQQELAKYSVETMSVLSIYNKQEPLKKGLNN